MTRAKKPAEKKLYSYATAEGPLLTLEEAKKGATKNSALMTEDILILKVVGRVRANTTVTYEEEQ